MKQSNFSSLRSSVVFMTVLSLWILLFSIGCDSRRSVSEGEEKTPALATGRMRIQLEEQRARDKEKGPAAGFEASRTKESVSTRDSSGAQTLPAAYPVVSDWLDFYESEGTFSPILDVYVRSARSGYVKTINYSPGAMARKGDSLITLTIDPSESGATTSLLPVGKSSEDEQITAPISGLALETTLQPGDWVEAGQTTLVRLVRIDYLKLTMPLSADQAKTLYRRYNRLSSRPQTDDPQSGNREKTSIPLVALIPQKNGGIDDSMWVDATIAPIDYIGYMIDEKTQTALVRAVVPNPRLEWLPGEKITAKIPGEITEKALLLDPTAAHLSLEDAFVYKIEQDGQPRIVQQFVELSPVEFGLRRIRAGLISTDLYVVGSEELLKKTHDFIVNVLSPDQLSAWEKYQREYNQYLTRLRNTDPELDSTLRIARQIQSGVDDSQPVQELPKAGPSMQTPGSSNNETNNSMLESGIKPEMKPEIKPEIKPAAKPEIKTEIKSEPPAPSSNVPTTSININTSNINTSEPLPPVTASASRTENVSVKRETQNRPASPAIENSRPLSENGLIQSPAPVPPLPPADRQETPAAPSEAIGRRPLLRAPASVLKTDQTTNGGAGNKSPQPEYPSTAEYGSNRPAANTASVPVRDPITGIYLSLPQGYYPLRYWSIQP